MGEKEDQEMELERQAVPLERFAVEYVKKLKIILEIVGNSKCLNLRVTEFMYIPEKLLY